MAEFTDNDGIRCFEPDNDETTLYIPSYAPMTGDEIAEQAKAHFGDDVTPEDFEVTAEHIHVRCLGFDAYDSQDWQTYIVLTRVKTPVAA